MAISMGVPMVRPCCHALASRRRKCVLPPSAILLISASLSESSTTKLDRPTQTNQHGHLDTAFQVCHVPTLRQKSSGRPLCCLCSAAADVMHIGSPGHGRLSYATFGAADGSQNYGHEIFRRVSQTPTTDCQLRWIFIRKTATKTNQ